MKTTIKEFNVNWLTIKNYENYLISSTGIVKRKKSKNCLKERIIKGVIHSEGYKVVTLYKNGIKKQFRVHKLVAEAFLDKNKFKKMAYENDVDINKLEVNHIDENKENNNVDNLEWCTREYNSHYGSRIEKTKINNPLKKTILKYDLNNNFMQEYISIAEAIRENNCRRTSIIRCLKGNGKTAGGFIWKLK